MTNDIGKIIKESEKKATFKVFVGYYSPPLSIYGGYYCYDTIVVAETESVALGLSLEKYPDTIAEGWEFEEIILDKHQVIEMHREDL